MGDTSNVWRIDADGSNPTQLTREKPGGMPICSPDGKWLLYWNDDERALYRLPVDGGSAEKLNLPNMGNPFLRISPDSKSVIYASENPKGAEKPYLFSIVDLAKGSVQTQFQSVPGIGMTVPQWNPEGHGFYLNLTRQGTANVWKMESPAGEVKQVTNFSSGLIASYVWSPDGKNLYVARGNKSSDVILVRSAK